MLNENNQKNSKRLIRFLSRKNENGYIFTYPHNTAQIKDINQQIVQYFKKNKQQIGVFFINKHQNKSLIQALTIYLKDKKYRHDILKY